MGDLTYNRDKNPATNVTPITITGEARELPNALAAIIAGTTGAFEVAVSGDADPSGGVAGHHPRHTLRQSETVPDRAGKRSAADRRFHSHLSQTSGRCGLVNCPILPMHVAVVLCAYRACVCGVAGINRA